jgi:hypothetical protein
MKLSALANLFRRTNPPHPHATRQSAGVLVTAEFIDVHAHSGYRSWLVDRASAHRRFSADASETELGAAILECLAGSKALSLKEMETRLATVDEDEEAWIANTMQRYSIRSRRALFKGMRSVLIERESAVIRFLPLHQVRLRCWEAHDPAPGKKDIVIASASEAAAVGQALRQAIQRCT